MQENGAQPTNNAAMEELTELPEIGGGILARRHRLGAVDCLWLFFSRPGPYSGMFLRADRQSLCPRFRDLDIKPGDYELWRLAAGQERFADLRPGVAIGFEQLFRIRRRYDRAAAPSYDPENETSLSVEEAALFSWLERLGYLTNRPGWCFQRRGFVVIGLWARAKGVSQDAALLSCLGEALLRTDRAFAALCERAWMRLDESSRRGITEQMRSRFYCEDHSVPGLYMASVLARWPSRTCPTDVRDPASRAHRYLVRALGRRIA